MTIKQKIVYQGDKDPLPPPGDERREKLAQREDALEKKAEELSEKMEAYSLDPSKLKVENELAQHFDFSLKTMLKVTNAKPDRAYCWANHSAQHGFDVTAKMSIGWQVVKGNDPECEEHKGTDTTRRIGDLILMWMPKDRYERLESFRAEQRSRIYDSEALTQEMRDHARKHSGSFIVLPTAHSSKVGSAQEFFGGPSPVHAQATEMLGNMLKEEIPGLPLPGKK